MCWVSLLRVMCLFLLYGLCLFGFLLFNKNILTEKKKKKSTCLTTCMDMMIENKIFYRVDRGSHMHMETGANGHRVVSVNKFFC